MTKALLAQLDDPEFKLVRKFVEGLDKDGNPNEVGNDIDMCDHLRHELAKLAMTPLSDAVVWTEDRRTKLYQAYGYLRTGILANARIVACTPVVSAEPDFRKHFGDGSERPVNVFYDEASTMSEAEALCPLSKTMDNYGKHIEALVMFGDKQQLGPLVIGGVTSSSATNKFQNQCSQSLMKRLVAYGLRTRLFSLREECIRASSSLLMWSRTASRWKASTTQALLPTRLKYLLDQSIVMAIVWWTSQGSIAATTKYEVGYSTTRKNNLAAINALENTV